MMTNATLRLTLMGRQSWETACSRSSPVGTAENCLRPHLGLLSAVPDGTGSCLQLYPGLTSWAKFSRPFGTFVESFPRPKQSGGYRATVSLVTVKHLFDL